MKKILCSLIVIVMFISSLTVSASADYSDIEGHWGQTYIQAMADKGSIKGYEDGTFKPDKTISRSEFLAIAIRSTFPDYQQVSDGAWWEGEYRTAIENGIITETEMSRSDMDAPIRREEMTMIMVRCAEANGESLVGYATGVSRTLSDYYKTGEYYRTYLIKAYTNGLIAGKPGNIFDAQGSATRAEAATVLYRIENKSARVKPEFKSTSSGTTATEDLSQPITIYEGQERTNRLAKVGDTVIKADGTSVVLALGPNGILGEGQGVAPDLGFYYNVKGANPSRVIDGKMFSGGALEDWEDSAGANIVGSMYFVHPLTGEGHWDGEWCIIYNVSYNQMLEKGIEGKYEGEVSADKQLIWLSGDWMPLYCNGEFLK